METVTVCGIEFSEEELKSVLNEIIDFILGRENSALYLRIKEERAVFHMYDPVSPKEIAVWIMNENEPDTYLEELTTDFIKAGKGFLN